MAIATTTFAERISRIEKGTTVQAASLPKMPRQHKSAPKAVKSILKLTAVGLVGCGAAYAWQMGLIDVEYIMELAS